MTCREKDEKKLTVGDVNEASRLGESTIVGTALKSLQPQKSAVGDANEASRLGESTIVGPALKSRQSHTSEYKVRQIVP